MKKTFIFVSLISLVGLVVLTGCSPLSFITNNADLCSIINCSQLGLVDYQGPHNDLVPENPNYDLDPTCTLPGMCGPNYWYPYATSNSTTGTSSGTTE
jgi:hypothetical protein